MNDNYEQMTLSEFIQLPNVGGIHIPYTPMLEKMVKEKPYMRLGKRFSDFVALYTTIETIGSMNAPYTHPRPLGLLGKMDLEASGVPQLSKKLNLDLKGSRVLLGFVDTGIDYTNPAFRHSNGNTRIKYIWDQSIAGSAPDEYLFGSEYTEEELNTALQSENPHSIVPHKDTAGHGTFLASVAGGTLSHENLGVAPEAEFIVVKLQNSNPLFRSSYMIPSNIENVYSSLDLMLGIQYLVEKAEELGMPISICIGVGTNFGSHDGTSVLEEYIESVTRKSGVCVSVAAGNESQAKHHTSGKFTAAGQQRNLNIKVAEELSDFMLLILLEPFDRMSIAMISPTGEVIAPITPKPNVRTETKLLLEQTTISIEYVSPFEISGGQITAVRFSNPTPGIWTIILYSNIFFDGAYQAWLPISSLSPPGLEFVEPNPNKTIVIPATTRGVVCCGAYDSVDNSLYVKSSWGPTRLSVIKPDLVAPGVDVVGVYPSGIGKMTGTSVSAAFTAGVSALLLQWGIVQGNNLHVSTNQIKAYLIRGCEKSPNIIYPNNQCGHGRLNIYQTFRQLIED